jgi:hypothetical protein
MKKTTLLLVIGFLLFPIGAIAWDGYDYDRGNYIEIDKGNLVRSGNDIEIYDYDTGDYKDVEVESISRSGGSVEIEVYDYDRGEHRNFDME